MKALWMVSIIWMTIDLLAQGIYHTQTYESHCIKSLGEIPEQEGGRVYKTGRILTDTEARNLLDEIVDIIVDTQNSTELRKDFQRMSKDAQEGYDIRMKLFHKGIVSAGTYERQLTLNDKEDS